MPLNIVCNLFWKDSLKKKEKKERERKKKKLAFLVTAATASHTWWMGTMAWTDSFGLGCTLSPTPYAGSSAGGLGLQNGAQFSLPALLGPWVESRETLHIASGCRPTLGLVSIWPAIGEGGKGGGGGLCTGPEIYKGGGGQYHYHCSAPPVTFPDPWGTFLKKKSEAQISPAGFGWKGAGYYVKKYGRKVKVCLSNYLYGSHHCNVKSVKFPHSYYSFGTSS